MTTPVLVIPFAAAALLALVITSLMRSARRDRDGRRRGVAGLLLGAVVAGGAVLAGISRPDLLGLPWALAPGLGAASGLLTYALWPSPGEPIAGPARASLTPRRWWHYPSGLASIRVAGLTVITAAVLVITGATSSVDELGRWRAFTLSSTDTANTASPYPGWWYGVPLLVTTALVGITTVLALHRVATRPVSPFGPVDDQARRLAAGAVVLGIGTSGLLGYLGGVLVVTGSALSSAYGAMLAQQPTGGWSTGFVVGWSLVVLGLVIIGVAVVTITTTGVRVVQAGPIRSTADLR